MDEWIIDNSTRRRKDNNFLCVYYLIFEKGKVLLFYKELQKRDYKKSFIWVFFGPNSVRLCLSLREETTQKLILQT